MQLQETIERLFAVSPDVLDRPAASEAVHQLKWFLNRGEVRAASCANGVWTVHEWVKKGILLGFRVGQFKEISAPGPFQFFDKDTMAVRRMDVSDHVRIVPGGTTVRDGAFIGTGVIIMPPAYINIGAYVDEGALIDSHALVGSCAQIGKRVHISAAAQIGGVLEPVGALPVIIEDDVLVGGNCGIYEGTIVRREAVIAAGVILTSSTPVYDLVRKEIYRKTADSPLIIPDNAVVVPGSRRLTDGWATSHGLAITTPVIVKYRDEKTDAATALEESLR